MPRIIDLTLPLENGLRGVSIESARMLEKDGWNATTLHLYSHCGTHMDAPIHFGVSGPTIDEIPLDLCMGPAWVVDPVCDVPASGALRRASVPARVSSMGVPPMDSGSWAGCPCYDVVRGRSTYEENASRRHYERALIRVADLGQVADKIREGDGLLLRTGWSRRVGDPSYRDELPRVSLELAEWCVAKKIRILGVEPPSVADVNNAEELTAVHRVLLQGGVILVEGLANLDQIRHERVTFMAFPLKVAGGDGAPVRAFAVEE
jgi:kynurenine formamidase